MSSKLLAGLSLAVAVPVVAGCGGGGGSSSTGGAAAKKRAAAPIRVFHLNLTGAAETPAGAPGGSGGAAVALQTSTKVCWRFAHLKGFAGATFAHIHQGAKGKSGNIVVPLSTAPKLRHRGCVSASSAVIAAIEKNPASYYVNIHSTKYPGGAVRAQL